MRTSYTASYSNCMHNFIIDGVPAGKCNDSLLHSFTCVLKNILTRSQSMKPSSFLQEKLGVLSDQLIFLPLVKKNASLPRWENTIKGAEDGRNPAKDFYYDDQLWSEYLPGYEWVRQLLIPEAPLEIILESEALWKDQAVDFYLPIAKLVIEIDGEQHNTAKQTAIDVKRDNALSSAGITTVRIPVSDLGDRTFTLKRCFDDIRSVLESSIDILLINSQEMDADYKKRILYESVLRYEFLIMELLDKGHLHLNQKTWIFDVKESDQNLVILACQDLFLWYQNLYQLKGLPFTTPSIQFTNEPGYFKLRNYLFLRPDERKVTCPTVLTSPWDDKNYYRVFCADPVDYEIPWPIPEDGDRGTALKFFLYELFGYKDFKAGQWEILSNLLLLKRTIGILPTGGGKSLCYQLAAMLQPGLSLVICPINSLQIDQKRNLDEAGVVHTAYIASMQDAAEKSNILKQLQNGQLQIIWISPERFQSRSFRETISTISQKFTIAYNVIDEVHCLSEWGHDFRTSYLTLISSLEKTCPKTTIIGLTATASQAVLEDLKVEFNIDGSSIRSLPSLERRNLTFRVLHTTESEKEAELEKILRKHHFGKGSVTPDTGLVFTLTRDQSDNPASYSKNKLKRDLSRAFPENGSQIGRFHSDAPDKVEVQQDFLDGKLRLLSTTKAFGMGVNKRDLRFTVHYSLPWSTESFYQEAGRAGRDEEPAECTILFAPEQFGQEEAINQVFNQLTPPETIKELVDTRQIKGDLSTIFYLWGGNNKGVTTDLDMIEKLMDRINHTPPQDDGDTRYFNVFSDFFDKNDEKLVHPQRLSKERLELALYRLKLLGVVDDWLIDWSTKPVSFDVYLDEKRSPSHVRESLITYFKRHLADVDVPEIPVLAEGFIPVILFYAKILLQWTYDHIAYTRRQATYQILRFCENYKDPISFRNEIDDYLRISEQTITLDGIIHDQDNYKLWFRTFYNEDVSEEWVRSEKLLDAKGIRQLRLSAARYRESYRDITGLNLVYVLSGIFSEYADFDIETPLLIDSFEKINQMDSEDREDIWKRIRVLVEHYHTGLNEEMLDGLAYCLAHGFPDKSREIYQLLEDPHSLAIIIKEYNLKIQQAAAGFRR